MSDEEADEIIQKMNWSEIAEGLKPHESIHGVIVHAVPKDIDLTDPQTIELFKEANHCIKPDAIIHITPLRRNPTEATHHSIIVFSKYIEELNTWLERGFSINYEIYRTERHTTQARIIQCFNCYEYGHHAKNCIAATCCGKYREPHETQRCKSSTVKCCQCKGPHEAWHHKCSVRKMVWKKLREIKHQLPLKFIERNHRPKELDSEEKQNFAADQYKFGDPMPTSPASEYSNPFSGARAFETTPFSGARAFGTTPFSGAQAFGTT